jgi:magnesium transporter
MKKIAPQGKPKAGLPPGSMVYIGDKGRAPTKVTLFDYEPDSYVQTVVADIDECMALKGDKSTTTWINVDGLGNTQWIAKLDSLFGVHPLVLEDIVNTEQRPKTEDYGDYIYIVVKMLYNDPKSSEMVSEQLSLVIGRDYLLSFQEEEGDYFNNIRDRIRQDKGRIRRLGSDYLAYVMLDTIVDNYFVVLEKFQEDIGRVEDRLMGKQAVHASELHHLKRRLIFLRKQIAPMREVVSALQRVDSKLIHKTTGVYLRDLYDHVISVMDTIDSFRDVLSGLHDIHLSAINLKTNEVVKLLTIISTIFMPLMLIVGIYGMNFEHMPELRWKYGYLAVWLVMIGIVMVMTVYFKRKKWF